MLATWRIGIAAMLVCFGVVLGSAYTRVVFGDFTLLREQVSSLELDLQKARDENAVLRKMARKERLKEEAANQEGLGNPQPVQAQDKRTSGVMTVTAYTPFDTTDGAAAGVTASAKPAREGMVAVSRDLFKQGWTFGKRVYVKNHGVYVIADLMAQTKRRTVDILMMDVDRALRFGRRSLDVVLLDA